MKKSLKEMTKEELWQLFPIIISEHKAYWKDYFKEEKDLLKKILRKEILHIHHIGSTAIPNIPAKPTIDILIEIKEDADIKMLISKMESVGYIYSPQPQKPIPHMMFMKGYTVTGFADKIYHTHIRYAGDWEEIHFRDYLLSHSKAAKEYGELKIKLKEQFEHDRDAYTMAKTDFITKITNLAKKRS